MVLTNQGTKIMVYDLGGEHLTFQSLKSGTVFSSSGNNGNNRLGGDDFDSKIMNYIADEFKRNTALTCARIECHPKADGSFRKG